MTIIFGGKSYSEKKKTLLKSSVDSLRSQGIVPHLATILIGESKASVLYTNLKKKFIESLGCQVDIYKLNESSKLEDIKLLIQTLNDDDNVNGIMIQLPLPESLKDKRDELINLISDSKDVDGLKSESNFLHPTSKAIMEILAMAILETKIDVMTVCVIGANGMVGRPIVKELKKLGYIVLEADSKTSDLKKLTIDADCIISATGVMNLVTSDMVREESIVIDAGSPSGDVSSDVYDKVSFITPVPGGVGPVTITCLAENLIIASNTN